MKHALTLLFAAALLGVAAPHAESRYFIGSWTCSKTPWTFAPLLPNAGWVRNTYGDPRSPDGSAVIGYINGLHRWIYRDFHADGSYADLTSPGPVGGRWAWTGPYYPVAGGAPLNGRITYVQVNRSRYDRVFEMLRAGRYVKMGGDRCLRTR